MTLDHSLTLLVAGLWIVREYQNYRERKDLLERIMARDYSEFMSWQERKKPKSDKVALERVPL